MVCGVDCGSSFERGDSNPSRNIRCLRRVSDAVRCEGSWLQGHLRQGGVNVDARVRLTSAALGVGVVVEAVVEAVMGESSFPSSCASPSTVPNLHNFLEPTDIKQLCEIS